MATIFDMFHAFRSDIKENSFLGNAYVRIVLGLLLVGAASWGVYFGYMAYRSYRNQEAQKVLSICLEEYTKALSGANELWPSVEMSCQLGYEQNRSSDLAPYFLAVKAEALLHQGKKSDVQEVLDTMMQSLPTSSPLHYAYATQKALIEMDADDPMVAQKGLDSLKVLADTKSNHNRDLALYYLGLYHWSHDQVEQAQDVWQELTKDFATSPWSQAVAYKLQQLV